VAKEQEARERAVEVYPPAGVEKLERNDVARAGLKKEAAKECSKCGKVYAEGEEVHTPDSPECQKYFAQAAEDAKKALADVIPPLEKKAGDSILPPKPDIMTAPSKLPESSKQLQTNEAAAKCGSCNVDVEPRKGFAIGNKVFCMPCHDKGHDMGMPKTAEDLKQHLEKDVAYFTEKIDHHKKVVQDLKDQLSKADGNDALKKTLDDQIKDNTADIAAMEKEIAERQSMKKEAAAKWKPGQHLLAKYNLCAASVVYVNEDDKIYVIKVEGTMYPSYYCFEDAYETFDAIKAEESKDSEWAKAHGVTKTAEEK
jgi:predicted  nucleic acid-binding Zn-ribbon protein